MNGSRGKRDGGNLRRSEQVPRKKIKDQHELNVILDMGE